MPNVKKELTINFSAKSIELAESFEKKASIYGSPEYMMLQNARKDFPTYRIEVIKKTKKAKDCHKCKSPLSRNRTGSGKTERH